MNQIPLLQMMELAITIKKLVRLIMLLSEVIKKTPITTTNHQIDIVSIEQENIRQIRQICGTK